MSVVDVLTYRTLIRDNLAFIENIRSDKIEFLLFLNRYVGWTLEAYYIAYGMVDKATLFTCRGCSPEEAYEEMLYETALQVEGMKQQQEEEWDY